MVMVVEVAGPVVTTMDTEDAEGAEESQVVHHHLLHHLIQSPILQVHILRKAIENMEREETRL